MIRDGVRGLKGLPMAYLWKKKKLVPSDHIKYCKICGPSQIWRTQSRHFHGWGQPCLPENYHMLINTYGGYDLLKFVLGVIIGWQLDFHFTWRHRES